MNPKVIAIVGPTASGKTSLAVWLAKKLDGEVVSADSRQVYKGLDIGTGKVTKQEMQDVPHHLLDVANPKRQFSADDFVRLGSHAIISIYRSGHIPIVVGGTGFYIDALLGRIVLPNVSPNKKLRERLEKYTTKQLFTQLKKLDPARAETIEPKHKRRIIRAIEIAQALGKNPPPNKTKKYDVLWIGLNPASQKLKKNIRIRLFARIKLGMLAEAKRLHKNGLSYQRMDELGLEYRFLAQVLQNKITREEFKMRLERAIQKYAKRQLRWFKRNQDIRWIKNKSAALRLAQQFIGERNS